MNIKQLFVGVKGMCGWEGDENERVMGEVRAGQLGDEGYV